MSDAHITVAYLLVLQMIKKIRGSVHLRHQVSVMSMPSVLRLHLTCVPVTRSAVTGVNAIKDTPGMDLPAQVSYLMPFILKLH